MRRGLLLACLALVGGCGIGPKPEDPLTDRSGDGGLTPDSDRTDTMVFADVGGVDSGTSGDAGPTLFDDAEAGTDADASDAAEVGDTGDGGDATDGAGDGDAPTGG